MPSWWSAPTSKHAFVLSWISVVLTLAATIIGISLYMSSGSALCLVFGLENSVDLFSSVVVLWRFYCPGNPTKEHEDMLLKREKRASLAISGILLLLGFGVTITAIEDLSNGSAGESTDEEFNTIWTLSAISLVLFGGLTIIKFHYAHKLSSASLYKDGLCSSIGTVLAIALLINTAVVEKDPELWWLDPFVALLCGIVSAIIGAHALFVARVQQGLPIFTWKWWVASQGDGMDEFGMRELEPADFDTGDGDSGDGKSQPSDVEMKGTESSTPKNEDGVTESEVV